MAGSAGVNPVLVNTWRGNAIECRHRGAVAVVDARGREVLSLGDIHRPEFPRSAVKYLQAIPLVETGAAANYALTDEHIAFACASHNAEPRHTDLAQSWLEMIDCAESNLACGAEMPGHKPTAEALLRDGIAPKRYHHNCSGKHLGLLTTCRFMHNEIEGYQQYDHASQQRWISVVESLTGKSLTDVPWGYDGCGIPTLALSLLDVATSFARFADPQSLSPERASAVERINVAVSRHPFMVAGSNRLCTALMELSGGKVMVKVGAEGYYTAVLREQGYGVALKIDDGASRASMVAIGAVLHKLGALSYEQVNELSQYLHPEQLNSRKDKVGFIEPAAVLKIAA